MTYLSHVLSLIYDRVYSGYFIERKYPFAEIHRGHMKFSKLTNKMDLWTNSWHR